MDGASPESYAQPRSQEEKPAKVCQMKVNNKLKNRAQRKVLLSSFFLTSPQFPPSILTEVPVPSANHSMTAHLHTQIKFVPPCHFCTTSLLLQSRE